MLAVLVGLVRDGFSRLYLDFVATLFCSASVKHSCQITFEIIDLDLPLTANLLGGKLPGLYKPVCGGLPYMQDRADVFQ